LELGDRRTLKNLHATEIHKTDFILGSAAEIKRFWSTVEKILTLARFSIHPIQLGAIPFSKVQKHLEQLPEL
jgi:hypothetical protein